MCMITSSSHEQTAVDVETNGLRNLKLEMKGPLKFRSRASKKVRIACNIVPRLRGNKAKELVINLNPWPLHCKGEELL